MRKYHTLHSFVESALSCYSKVHPQELVHPNLFSCFVHSKRNGFFYPVISIEVDINTSVNEPAKARLNINSYSFCRNPIEIKTPFKGMSLAELRIHDISCPQLGCDLDFNFNNDYFTNGILVLEEVNK